MSKNIEAQENLRDSSKKFVSNNETFDKTLR